ncbi:XdhC family protein [Pseudomonas rustica]
MSGIDTLLGALQTAQDGGQDCVLATVVKVEGSAYRRTGARMLVSRFGRAEGTISGGCLEAAVAKKAWWLTESGPAVRSYSTAIEDDDGDEALSFGLGCNGKVHVLFERLPCGVPCLLTDALKLVRDSRQPAALATVISSHPLGLHATGERLLLMSGQTVTGDIPCNALAGQIVKDLQKVLQEKKSSLHHYIDGHEKIEVFLEYLPPARRLVIFGAGHDAQPLVRMAKMLGWHVSVVDSRAHFARPERFPEADVVMVGDISRPFAYGELVEQAAVAIMTHSLIQDTHWLDGVLQCQPSYIGQLGPRERTERLLSDISIRRGALSMPDTLHYPIGLDLGGDTPESVAIAVLAEIQASFSGRSGGHLRLRPTKIHDIDPVAVSVVKKEISEEAHQPFAINR